jgi:hypothetical protein
MKTKINSPFTKRKPGAPRGNAFAKKPAEEKKVMIVASFTGAELAALRSEHKTGSFARFVAERAVNK